MNINTSYYDGLWHRAYNLQNGMTVRVKQNKWRKNDEETKQKCATEMQYRNELTSLSVSAANRSLCPVLSRSKRSKLSASGRSLLNTERRKANPWVSCYYRLQTTNGDTTVNFTFFSVSAFLKVSKKFLHSARSLSILRASMARMR